MGGEQINVTEPYGGSRTSYHDPPKLFDPPPPNPNLSTSLRAIINDRSLSVYSATIEITVLY